MEVTKEFLDEARKLVGGDRQKDYGDKVQIVLEEKLYENAVV